ncbi:MULTISPECIES: hypothetical protein [unclassified Tenacibaculum]|uniref:hypothetical protein n=1 Tax=unclassified Tenacibaculum TaxID=2635139 RepID=UPI001F31AA87|nr:MULTISPECIES: hypothetical protein [unclassified Tenacibaculum]MCF2873383.1 hypothetical protein [Tenacibaculum sp. Cn5-1]MCF2933539.1 hypothetical protein [Tenacibaculum sp. Cn5-34]MCG7509879.1 hypothetical protein [Tenacibaculum sp. Cn5-46]
MNWLKRNKFLVVLFILLIGGYSAYKYAYKPHKTIEELNVDFEGSSTVFLQKVSQNFSEWNTKIVQLSGKVTAIDENGISLENQIYCQFKNTDARLSIKENDNIQIKGRVIGYDDLLDELKLEQCILK